MQQAARRRPSKTVTLSALVCAAFIVLTFVLAEMKPWSRKPADAGVCPNNTVQWQQTALKGKINGEAGPAFKSKSFTIQDGARWDGDDRDWVVPFRTPDQQPGDKNFTALIDCTGSVEIKGGGQ